MSARHRHLDISPRHCTAAPADAVLSRPIACQSPRQYDAAEAITVRTVQPTQILATKLFIPPLPPKAVLRPRLVERLDDGLHCKLTLVSAPAGFGKTTLLSAWVAGCHDRVAWLSLDPGDNDRTRFLNYLVAALRSIEPTVGEAVLGALQSPQPPSTESLLTALLNEITMIPHTFVLVIDDTSSMPNQLTMLSPFWWSTCQLECAWSSRLARIHRYRWHGYAAGASSLRTACHGLALFSLRSCCTPQPGDGSGAFKRRHRCAGDPHRRMGCWPAIGRGLSAGTHRRKQFHPVLQRQPPFRPGLSARGSPASPVRKRSDVLVANIHPRPDVRPIV